MTATDTNVTTDTEVAEEPHPTSSPEAAYNFLIKKFHGKTEDGTVHLYRIGCSILRGRSLNGCPCRTDSCYY